MSKLEPLNLNFAGADIQISWSSDNRLVIDVATGEINPKLAHANGCPRIRLWINEGCMQTDEAGDLVQTD